MRGSNLFNFHNSPLTITLLDLMFEINGLNVTAILRDKTKRKQYFLLPLVLLLKAGACLSSQESKKKHAYDLTLKNEVILGGNTLIFITQKKCERDESPPVSGTGRMTDGLSTGRPAQAH